MKIQDKDILNIRLPRWSDFPPFELYIDQVISFLCERLEPFNCNQGEPLITQSMINNYVKNGVLHPPVKKKYNRTHLAKLVVICIVKRMLPLSSISEAITVMSRAFDIEEGYNLLCDEIEYEIKSVTEPEKYPLRSITDAESRNIALMRTLASAIARVLICDRLIERRKRLSLLAGKISQEN